MISNQNQAIINSDMEIEHVTRINSNQFITGGNNRM